MTTQKRAGTPAATRNTRKCGKVSNPATKSIVSQAFSACKLLAVDLLGVAIGVRIWQPALYSLRGYYAIGGEAVFIIATALLIRWALGALVCS